jgi:hypothetical protein
MEEFTVACSLLTSTIFAGRPDKNGQLGSVKHDVTIPAIYAVAQHFLQKGEAMEFTYKGDRYLMQVVKIDKTTPQ